MNVASLELCKELYELSGWESEHQWGWIAAHEEYEVDNGCTSGEPYAYDLGYLLRKLPAFIDEDNYQLTMSPTNLESWNIGYINDGEWLHSVGAWSADTPEDAAAKLAIELFKQGVLTR